MNKRSRACNTKIKTRLLIVIVFMFITASYIINARFDDQKKREDVDVLNNLLTQRDRERNKMFYRITYQGLIE